MASRCGTSRGTVRWISIATIVLLIASIAGAMTSQENTHAEPRKQTIQATQASPSVRMELEGQWISTTTSISVPPVTTPSPTTTKVVATSPNSTSPSSANPARVGGSNDWDAVAQCESGGNWASNTGNGYYGGLQMDMDFWNSYSRDLNPRPARPDLASRDQQIHAAENAFRVRGSRPWPHCGRYL